MSCVLGFAGNLLVPLLDQILPEGLHTFHNVAAGVRWHTSHRNAYFRCSVPLQPMIPGCQQIHELGQVTCPTHVLVLLSLSTSNTFAPSSLQDRSTEVIDAIKGEFVMGHHGALNRCLAFCSMAAAAAKLGAKLDSSSVGGGEGHGLEVLASV